MSPVPQVQTARDWALQARGGPLPPGGAPAPVILDSWVRSLHCGLDAAAPLRIQVVDAGDLARRRIRAGLVRRLAQAQMETLAQQIAGSNFLLAFADPDGVILDSFADNRFAMDGDAANIVAGSQWSEALCGTNGLGTALAHGRSVAVSGAEHFSLALDGLTCTASPVRDAAGDVVGVLDASSCYAARQQHTQALVQMAATHIENDLLLDQMRQRWVLALHPRAEYLGTLSAGLLAFDAGGRLCALNAQAQRLLAGLGPLRGCQFETLFDAPFLRSLDALLPGAELALRDRLGSALVARLLGRPAVGAVAARPAQPAAQRPPAAAPVAPLFIADDAAVAEACRTVQAAARMGVPVLIRGETGTGKELLARHAHQASGRRGPFVAVNCGALPDDLFEAELFGHVGGAFTGARREGSIGLIASADGGTLLLDEVRELPLHLQPALLRFLDDQLVRPVGGTQSRRVDVQLLAACAVDLAVEVAARRFRDDLMYRLAVVQVVLPPLRDRQDFARAAHQLLATLDPSASLSEAAMTRLAQHAWPGNFRELRAVLTRAVLACRAQGRATALQAADLAACMPAGPGTGPAAASGASLAGAGSPGRSLHDCATLLVQQAYEDCGHNVSRTAQTLGISRTTVYRHLRQDVPADGASDAASAVHLQAHAGDHAGLVAAQKAGGVAQVLGLAEAADRDGRQELGAHLGRVLAHEALQQRGLAGHRVERDHADAEGRQLHRIGPRGGDHPAFAGVVPAQARPRADTRRAGHIEHHAADALQARRIGLQARHGLAHGQVDRLHIDRHDAVEVVLGHVLQRLRQMGDAGVVDEDVEAAEMLLGGGHHQAHIGGLGHVHLDRPRRRAQRCGHIEGLGPVAVGDQHLRALGHELGRDAGAKARRRAGDDGHLVLQSHGGLRGPLAGQAASRLSKGLCRFQR